jgi:hypothetical protein
VKFESVSPKRRSAARHSIHRFIRLGYRTTDG